MRSPESSAILAVRTHLGSEIARLEAEAREAEKVFRALVEQRLAAERAYTATAPVLQRIEAEDKAAGL